MITADSSSSSSREGLALGAHELEQRVERLAKARLVAVGHRRDGVVVDRVQALERSVVQPVLALAEDADDHEPFPSSICTGSDPAPTSAFILASSSST